MNRLFALLILTCATLLPNRYVFAENLGQSCPEFTCTCQGTLFPEVQATLAEYTNVQEGSRACAEACSAMGTSGKWQLFCGGTEQNQGTIPVPTPEEKEKKEEYPVPKLSVPIPGLTFSQATNENGELVSSYLSQYVKAIYSLAIVISAIGIVLTIMIEGMKWMMARGDRGVVHKAQDHINEAFTALFILLLVVSIVELVDPNLTRLDGLRIPILERIEIAYSDGEEGSTTGAMETDCQSAKLQAQAEAPCTASARIGSPTGSPPSCNYHFRDASYNYTKIRALDYPASFGTPIQSPFAGTVTYVQGNGADRCGNRIRLSGGGLTITMCHVQNFLDQNGTAIRSGSTVTKGQIIGHVGGACCQGQNPPSSWSQSDKCTVSGTPCTDPNKNESCQCQPYAQSGNTSGPHVHITYTSGSSYMLSCLE